MKSEHFISSYILLRDNVVTLNGQVIYEHKDANAGADFLDKAYEFFGLNYPKFHKMDNLCKTGFLAVEFLLQNRVWKAGLQSEEVGVIVSNSHSSLDTDIRYEESLATTPSPSLFVYTLPNVLIGELCIRHQVKGETACFVFDIFDASFQAGYVDTLFETGKIKACISGWADYYDGKAESFFYVVESIKQNNLLKHDSQTLNKIFQSHE